MFFPIVKSSLSTPEKFQEFKDALSHSLNHPLFPPQGVEISPEVTDQLNLEVLELVRVVVTKLSDILELLDALMDSQEHFEVFRPDEFDGTDAEFAWTCAVSTATMMVLNRLMAVTKTENLPVVLFGTEPETDNPFGVS